MSQILLSQILLQKSRHENISVYQQIQWTSTEKTLHDLTNTWNLRVQFKSRVEMLDLRACKSGSRGGCWSKGTGFVTSAVSDLTAQWARPHMISCRPLHCHLTQCFHHMHEQKPSVWVWPNVSTMDTSTKVPFVPQIHTHKYNLKTRTSIEKREN